MNLRKIQEKKLPKFRNRAPCKNFCEGKVATEFAREIQIFTDGQMPRMKKLQTRKNSDATFPS